MARLTANEAALSGFTHARTLTYNDFTESAANTAQTLDVVPLPAWCVIEEVNFYIEEPWDTGGTLACTIGYESDADHFAKSFDPTSTANLTVTSGLGFGIGLWTAFDNADAETGDIQDSDTASSVGTALHVTADNNGVTGFFESTTAGNADTSFRLSSTGSWALVRDNDSPGGNAVYFDEDAPAVSQRLIANNATGRTIYVPTSGGDYIAVHHDATPSGEGVQVYFDDDGSLPHERLFFTSPTNADGTFRVDETYARKAQQIAGFNKRRFTNIGGTLQVTMTPSGGAALTDSTQGRLVVMARILDLPMLVNNP